MGAIRKLLPITYSMMIIGSISIMGIPFMTGFYSKELILELGFGSTHLSAGIGYWLCTIAALFTAIYSMRLIITSFISPNNGRKESLISSHEPKFLMIFVLIFLALISVVFGYLTNDIFSLGSNIFSSSLYTSPIHRTTIYLGGALYPILLTGIGIIIGIVTELYGSSIFLRIKLTSVIITIYTILIKRYYFDILYSQIFTKGVLNLGYITAKELDNGITEILGPTGITRGLKQFGRAILLENGHITLYGQHLVLSLLLLSSYFILAF